MSRFVTMKANKVITLIISRMIWLITIKISDDSEITYWENDIQIGNDEDFVFIEDEFDYIS